MKVIDGRIIFAATSYYNQTPEVVKQMEARIARGLCMFAYCPGVLFEDGRCQDHYVEAIKPETLPPGVERIRNPPGAWEKLCEERNARGLCMWFNCDEPLAVDGECVGCNRTHLDLERLREENPTYNSGQIMRAYEAERSGRQRGCIYLNCKEPVVTDGKCGDHYNADLEAQKPAEPSAKELKEAAENAKELDMATVEEMADPLNLEWWFEHYGEAELPAKFINPDFYLVENWSVEEQGELEKFRVELASLSKRESLWLNEKLKELDGTPVNGGSHIWTFMGRKHYKREGQQNIFACVPVDQSP